MNSMMRIGFDLTTLTLVELYVHGGTEFVSTSSWSCWRELLLALFCVRGHLCSRVTFHATPYGTTAATRAAL